MRCFIYFCVLFTLSCNTQKTQVDKYEVLEYVDPFIGTTGGGNQQPGSRLPFGSVHLSPVNLNEFTPKSTNYRYGESNIFGFSLVNISGVGCSNYGGILLMPFTNMPDMKDKGASYTNEVASPGYYSVDFPGSGIKTELTSTMRCAYSRFSYSDNDAFITLDLSRRHPEDTSFYINQISETEFSGYKKDGVFCGSQGSHTLFFYTKIRQKPDVSGLLMKGAVSDSSQLCGEDIAMYAQFKNANGRHYDIISGISYVSIENAKENLETEIGNASFDEIYERAKTEWEEKLSEVNVEGGTKDDKTKFYTALYHTMSHPNIINDMNGEYPAMSSFKTMKKESGHNRYSLYSLWDTYRNVHSLFALLYPDIQSDMVQSMVDMYEEYGWLPHWELISIEKGVMNGDPAPIVIADSYLRGIRDFDVETAYKAMVHNAENSYTVPDRDNNPNEMVRDGVEYYLDNNGYIPHDFADKVWGSVATTQEYNLSDWNIAQMAKSLGKANDYEKFMQRSKGYRYFWDESTNFFRPRYSDGSFLKSFDPLKRNGAQSWPGSGGPGFCEGHAWNYLYFAHHDIKYLRDSLMGKELFVNKLQEMFDNNYYSATNEPDIAFPYLFNYVDGEEWRTQKQVSNLIENEYSTGPDGIPGNDDAGTLSAWLVFSSMGFYPDCPGNMNYQITAPLFDKITIKLNSKYYNGNEFVITSQKESENSVYIKDMKLNGKKTSSFSLNHNDIVKGGKFHFNLVDSLD